MKSLCLIGHAPRLASYEHHSTILKHNTGSIDRLHHMDRNA